MNYNKEQIEFSNFKTPEELAKILEQKTKNTLATKIREIAGQIQSTSIDWREKLSKELSRDEKEEIKAATAGNYDNTSKQILEESAIKVIGEENVDKIKNIEGLFNKITTSFDKLGKIFNEKGFIAGLGAMILMFKGIFTGDFSLFDRILNPEGEKGDGKKGKEDNKKEKNVGIGENEKDELKYIGGIKLLFLVKGEKGKEYIQTILLGREIRTKSFNELNNNFKKGEKGISGRLGLKGNDKEIYSAIKLLIDNEGFINSTIGKISPNWREKEIKDILSDLNKKGSLLNGINTELGKIQFSLINLPDSLNKAFNNVLNIKFNTEKNEIDFGYFSEQMELINGISKSTLVAILSTKEKIKNPSNEFKNRFYNICKEDERIFIDKLFDFYLKITETISSLFGNKNYKEFKNYFYTHGISFKDLIELYLITGGESKLENMDSVTQSLFYVKTWGILGEDGGFRGENFNKELLIALKEKNIIPEDVKLILINIFLKIGEVLLNKTTNAMKEIFNSISTTDKMIIVALIAASICLSGKLNIIKTATIATITGIIMGAIVGTNGNSKKYNKEQIEVIVRDYLKENNIKIT